MHELLGTGKAWFSMILQGEIKGYDGQALTIKAPFSDTFGYVKKRYTGCEIRLDDGRRISTYQRKKIYATLRDMSEYTGHDPEYMKELMKFSFMAETGREHFSLSNCDMTTARDYLEYLIEFCVTWDIPCTDSLAGRSPDIARYIYICLKNKKCCITGQKAQLHHVDAVGMGRDRKDIIHIGMRVLPLHWRLHKEAHDIGQAEFDKKYHVFGIRLDEDICKVWRLKKE